MSTGYQIDDQYGMYFITCTIVDWVDVFTRRLYRDIIIDSLQFCIGQKGLKVYGYVIMSNHLHLIVASATGKLSDTIRDFKKFTANKIIEAVTSGPESRREWLLHRFKWNASQHTRNEAYQVWTHENHAINITSKSFFDQKLDYIHQNPVRNGLVMREEEYVYSSAFSDNKVSLCQWYD
jgi:REP element-mobilizing transposase RayT